MRKKIIKIILVITVAVILLIILGLIYLYFVQKDKVAVLTFHNVVNGEVDLNSVDISVEKFEKYIKYLHDHNYKTLTMDEFYEWKTNGKDIPRKSVLITFDDGWRNFYTEAMPILQKYDMKASVFVIWKYFENCTNEDIDMCAYMDFEDINDIIENYPNIEILSHSYDLHIKEFANSDDYEMYTNDMQIVKYLSEKNIEYYAYPFGDRNENYIKALKDNEFKLAFTFGPYDFAKKDNDNFQIPRIGIFESTNDVVFKLKMFLKMNNIFKHN